MINATQILSIAHLQSCSLDRSAIPATTETVESKFIIKSIKNRVQNLAYHQKSIKRNFNIASKTACRGFKSFCPCHWQKVRRCSTAGHLRTFSMPESPDWTRSIDTGLPWQNPPNAPIFVNSGAAAVRYIIKKASANFGRRTVLYRVPRMDTGGEKKCIFFVQPWCADKNT